MHQLRLQGDGASAVHIIEDCLEHVRIVAYLDADGEYNLGTIALLACISEPVLVLLSE